MKWQSAVLPTDEGDKAEAYSSKHHYSLKQYQIIYLNSEKYSIQNLLKLLISKTRYTIIINHIGFIKIGCSSDSKQQFIINIETNKYRKKINTTYQIMGFAVTESSYHVRSIKC